MRRILLLCLMLWMASLAGAAERKFPYEAVIDVTEEFVRSGPGQKFYPTSKLRRGERVTVHRHDAGGWVMISPPEGSFSWIQAEHVRRKGERAGVLIENNVIVRVGSHFNDDRDWYQRELSKGDVVEILSEHTFETDRGPVKMYKIKPPHNEYRWILIRALVPADAPVRRPLTQDDLANSAPPPIIKSPVNTKGNDPFADGPLPNSDVTERPVRDKKKSEPTESTRHTGPDSAELEQMRSRLTAIDDDFRAMIKEDPPAWNLTGLEQRYQQLQEISELPAFHTQIKLRLDAVRRYAKIKEEYDDFVRVTNETKQRDAQLMSLSNQPGGQPPVDPGTTAAPINRSVPAAPKSFDGAGIIQRAVTTNGGAGPRYMLVTPEGRMLAYLQSAPGVDLNGYVGQAMGVIGQRSYRQELQAELIVVRSLQPVRLKGAAQ